MKLTLKSLKTKWGLAAIGLALFGSCSAFPNRAAVCRDKCEQLDEGVLGRLADVLYEQKDYAQDHGYLVIGKSAQDVFNATGDEDIQPLREIGTILFTFDKNEKAGRYFDFHVPVSTADKFVLRGDPISPQVRGLIGVVQKTDDGWAMMDCLSKSAGVPAEDPILVDGRLQCQG